jgi:glycosyltransferase involved in cell wall biosynthesis
MRRSDAGLDPLPDRYDFLATVNNKAVEYLSAGLPIISSPRRGVLYDLLTGEACGLSYPAGSTDELVGILDHLQADALALARMADRARALFDRSFAADTVHAQMTAYLAEVVESTRAPAPRDRFSR